MAVSQQGSPQLAAFAVKMQAKHGSGAKHGIQKIANGVPSVIVPTGSPALDRALRVGGVLRGRIYEVLGPKDSGKSTLGLSILIQHLLAFGNLGVGYINLENTFDPVRAMAMGLDCSDAAIKAGRWFPMLPASSEEASDMTMDLITSGLISCVVLDSIGAMESSRVLGQDAGKGADAVGRNAKIITQLTKKIATEARLNGCTAILINQPRANIGGMGADISAGPKAMQHSTTAKIEMRALGNREDGDIRTLKIDGEEIDVSIRSRMKVTRMKNGIAGRVAETYVNRIATAQYGPPGFDVADDYLTVGVKEKIIQLGGAWYTFPDGHRSNGKIAAAAYLRETPGAVQAVRAAMTFDVPIDFTEESHAPDPA